MTFEMLMEERFEAGMEKGIAKGRAEGITQGTYNNKLETAKKLLLKGMSPVEISEVTGLPLDTVLELKDQL